MAAGLRALLGVVALASAILAARTVWDPRPDARPPALPEPGSAAADERGPCLVGAPARSDDTVRPCERAEARATEAQGSATMHVVGSVVLPNDACSDVTIEILGGLPYREQVLAERSPEQDGSFQVLLEPHRRIPGVLALCVRASGFLPVCRNLPLQPGAGRVDVGPIRVDDAGSALKVRIVGPNGVPLPGIRCRCAREPGQALHAGWRPDEWWWTDAGGRFRSDALPPGRCVLHVIGRAGRHAIGGLEARDEEHTIELADEPEPHDLEATVRVTRETPEGPRAVTECRVHGEGDPEWTLLDATSGLWRLRVRAVVPYLGWVEATREGEEDREFVGTQVRVTTATGGVLDAYLRRPRTLRGRVLVDGTPVAANVRLYCVRDENGVVSPPDGRRNESVEGYCGQTGPDGRFRIFDLPPGRALLDLDGPTCLTGVDSEAVIPVLLRAPQVVDLEEPHDVLVKAERSLEAVVDVGPGLVPHDAVAAEPLIHWVDSDDADDEPWSAFGLVPERQGEHWRFTLEPWYGHRHWDLFVTGDEGWAWFPRVGSGTRASQAWTPWHRLVGRLEGPAGEPVGGIELRVDVVATGVSILLARAEGFTREDGTFALRVPSPGPWRVTLGEPLLGLSLPPLEATAGGPRLVLTLERAAPPVATSPRR